ncbi:MAG: CDP-diacylglycerol--glycerol-3-phosphate 3-phosphatidyltransferase [Phycisphaerae bacterium]
MIPCSRVNLNLPNKITLARLLLAIVFFILLAQYSQRDPQPWKLDVGVAIFIVAAVTDILDGYLARKRGLETALGRLLDPFVDKVLVCGAFIMMAGPAFVDTDGVNVTAVRAWMVVVIVGRELLVTGLRGFNESAGKPFPASVYGTIKMWMQSIAVPVILFLVAREATATWDASWMKLAVMWLTVVVTALSTVHYLIKSRHILEAGGA